MNAIPQPFPVQTDPDKLSGTPTVGGRRLPVEYLFRYGVGEFRLAFPDVPVEEIDAVIDATVALLEDHCGRQSNVKKRKASRKADRDQGVTMDNADKKAEHQRQKPEQAAEPGPPPEFYRITDVCAVLGVGRSTVYKLIQTDSDFPQKVQISSRAVRWRRVDIEEWVRSRTAV